MFGLPIYRRKTPQKAETPKQCTDPYGCDPVSPKVLKSSLRLCQMTLNHYSLIISADWKHLMTWGGTPMLGRTGVTTESNKPVTCAVDWEYNIPRSIVRAFSRGSIYGNTIFKTEDGSLYATGSNKHYLLNKTSTKVQDSYKLVTKNVVDFYATYSTKDGWDNNWDPLIGYMLYVKSDGKVYGLGDSNVGFGFPSTAQKDLKIDDDSGSNYLGVENAVKVFCTCPFDKSKSFVLKDDGTVVACGYNTDGCLGVNKNDAIVYEWSNVITSDDGGITFKNLTNVVDVVTTNTVVKGGANSGSVSWNGVSGDQHMSTYFLTSDGFVYTCGNNLYGQLGTGQASNQTSKYAVKTSVANASQMCTAAGGTSILITTFDNEVYTWGNNQWGQLGLGDTSDRNQPTQATFPAKKIKMIHGGGMYGIVNGAFLVVCEDGTVYGAGFNETFALGITNNGVPNPGPILTFTKNEYFGDNPPQNQDPQRYPLSLIGDITTGSIVIKNASLKEDKTITKGGSTWTEAVYIQPGMVLSGYGIQPGTQVRIVEIAKNQVTLTLPVTATQNGSSITYSNSIRVFQADLCGYGTEMAQKIATEDGTLYMSGWNQQLGDYWNFNYYFGSQNVNIPTEFDANFS